MTTLATPPPSVGGSPHAEPYGGPARMVRVSANLLPDTVIAARRLRRLQRQLGLGLVALLALLLIGYCWSWLQTSSARGDLSSAQHRNAVMHDQMRAFAPLLTLQSEQQGIINDLHSVMATDLQWNDVWSRINAKAGHSVQVTGFTGSVMASSAGISNSGLSVLNHTGFLPVGTISLTGTATDSKAVAAFVDALSTTKGFASPIPMSVSGAKGGSVIFTIDMLLTSDALGGRFSIAPATSTGGH